MAKKRKYGEFEKFEKLFSFFFHARFPAFTQGILDFFSRTVVEISRMDFLKKFSRKELGFTHNFDTKFHAKNWLSRTLSKKKITEGLHFFTYKKKNTVYN